METIKLNNIRPSLSPARKIKRTDPRGRNNQQSFLKETFERRQKKKKKGDHERVAVSERETIIRARPRNRQADRKVVGMRLRSCGSSYSRIIDIRV